MTTSTRILIRIPSQTLELYRGRVLLHRYSISTGVNGAGGLSGSGCTPLGRHRVRIRIGDGCSVGTVFRGRRPTGEVYNADLGARFPERDWILTRILWLTGLEPGVNRGGCVDTLRRFIYIHGCPETEPMGIPCSHGCVRMRDRDLIALFEQVSAGTLVDIVNGGDTDA